MSVNQTYQKSLLPINTNYCDPFSWQCHQHSQDLQKSSSHKTFCQLLTTTNLNWFQKVFELEVLAAPHLPPVPQCKTVLSTEKKNKQKTATCSLAHDLNSAFYSLVHPYSTVLLVVHTGDSWMNDKWGFKILWCLLKWYINWHKTAVCCRNMAEFAN